MPKGLIVCPSCGAEMVREYSDGRVKLRAKILIWDAGKCAGKCGRCGVDVPIPLSLPTWPVPVRKKNMAHIVFPR
jgi:hypothetical protein